MLELELKAVVLTVFKENPGLSLQTISEAFGVSVIDIIHDLERTACHRTVTMGKAIPALNNLFGPTPNILRLVELDKNRFLEEVERIGKRNPKPATQTA